MGTLKAAALILTVRAALIGGPGAVWPIGPADEGRLPMEWQLQHSFGDAFLLPAAPWQVTGDTLQFDARSGLMVITEPSDETVRALHLLDGPKAVSSMATDGPGAGVIAPVSITFPTADDRRTAYLEEIEPGLYRRKDMAELNGYTAKVGGAQDGDKTSITIDLSYQELADGKFEEALGAYVSRPAVNRKETQYQCSQSVPTQVLLIWRVPGLSHGHGLPNGPGLFGTPPGTDRPRPEQPPSTTPPPSEPINLRVSDARLADVVAMLAEACPGVQVVLADAALRDCRVTALNFQNATLASVLRGICAALGLQCDWDGERWLLRKGPALLPPGFPGSVVSGFFRPQLVVLVDLRPADGAGGTPDVDAAHPAAPTTAESAVSPPVPSRPPVVPAPPTAGDAPTGAPSGPPSPTAPQPQPITDDPELAHARLKELETDLEAAKIRLEQAKRRAQEGKARAEAATITTSEAADLQEAYDLAKVNLAKVEAQIATQRIVIKRARAAENKDVTAVIAGEIGAPGAYTLPPGSTVVDLIMKAGFLTGRGDGAHVALTRTAEGPEVRELDLTLWLVPREDVPATLPTPEPLMSGDVIVVPPHAADPAEAPLLDKVSATPDGASVSVAYVLGKRAAVTAQVSSMHGRLVARLAERVEQAAGPHTLTWSRQTDRGEAMPAGQYVVYITARTAAGREQRSAALVNVEGP